MKFLNVLWCVILSQVLIAQLPNTSLFSLQIENSKDSNWIIRKVEFLSNFNPASYNNQPFLVNENLMLASIKLKTSDNTEIYKFDLQKKSYSNLTKSSASEYSPRCSSALLNSFTCVQVPRDDTCLLYTSDAADERSSVDLGGRRIIKTKKMSTLVSIE